MPLIERYERNQILKASEQELLSKMCVAIVGLGGLGGYVAEQLARLGIGRLVLIDGDVFVASNLNRQLFSTEQNTGQSKSRAAFDRLSQVNSEVSLTPYDAYLTAENCEQLLQEAHVIVDALDNNDSRKCLVSACSFLLRPLVHGAIGGWYGQVATEFPGDGTIDRLLKSAKNRGIEANLGNPAFLPGVIASIQVSEVVKILTGKGRLLRHGFLHCDLLDHEYEFIEFNA